MAPAVLRPATATASLAVSSSADLRIDLSSPIALRLPIDHRLASAGADADADADANATSSGRWNQSSPWSSSSLAAYLADVERQRQKFRGSSPAPVARPQPHSKLISSTLNNQTHEQQVQAFCFTVVIIMFYALTILYFMLKQICRQEKEHKQMLYKYVFGREAELREREKVFRATMKKQLCMHLIKMGQLTQTLVSIGHRSNDKRHELRSQTRDQGTEIDDELLLIQYDQLIELRSPIDRTANKNVRFAVDS